MAYADQQMSGNKIIAIIIVALIHVGIGYALITGLAYSAVKKAIERVTTVDIEEPPPPPDEPPPPPPVIQPSDEDMDLDHMEYLAEPEEALEPRGGSDEGV